MTRGEVDSWVRDVAPLWDVLESAVALWMAAEGRWWRPLVRCLVWLSGRGVEAHLLLWRHGVRIRFGVAP